MRGFRALRTRFRPGVRTRIDWILMDRSAKTKVVAFSRPYLEKIKAIARRLGSVPMLPSESACTSPMCACCSSDAPAGLSQGPAPSGRRRPFLPARWSCNQQDGCSSPSRPFEIGACDMSDMASARLNFARFSASLPSRRLRNEPTGEDVHAKAICTGR